MRLFALLLLAVGMGCGSSPTAAPESTPPEMHAWFEARGITLPPSVPTEAAAKAASDDEERILGDVSKPVTYKGPPRCRVRLPPQSTR